MGLLGFNPIITLIRHFSEDLLVPTNLGTISHAQRHTRNTFFSAIYFFLIFFVIMNSRYRIMNSRFHNIFLNFFVITNSRFVIYS